MYPYDLLLPRRGNHPPSPPGLNWWRCKVQGVLRCDCRGRCALFHEWRWAEVHEGTTKERNKKENKQKEMKITMKIKIKIRKKVPELNRAHHRRKDVPCRACPYRIAKYPLVVPFTGPHVGTVHNDDLLHAP